MRVVCFPPTVLNISGREATVQRRLTFTSSGREATVQRRLAFTSSGREATVQRRLAFTSSGREATVQRRLAFTSNLQTWGSYNKVSNISLKLYAISSSYVIYCGSLTCCPGVVLSLSWQEPVVISSSVSINKAAECYLTRKRYRVLVIHVAIAIRWMMREEWREKVREREGAEREREGGERGRERKWEQKEGDRTWERTEKGKDKETNVNL